MPTDVPPDRLTSAAQPGRLADGDSQRWSRRRWWKRSLLAIGVVALLAAAGALLPGTLSSRETGPKQTHTITRGDLLVTVTEQGILESSENTEIKCKVRGQSTVIWVIKGGSVVEPGDVLVRLDTLVIEDAISERTKYAHWSRSAAERSRANVEHAELAISEYLEGRYRSQLMTLEKDLAIAESTLRTARNMLSYTEMMADRKYVSELDVERSRFAVTRADLDVKDKQTQIEVLKEYTNKMQLETLQGNLNAAKARLAADEERAKMDAIRRDIAEEELKLCVIKAEKSGLVIFPAAAQWMVGPEITEGATVHKDQVLLLMPDLSKMQVKVGVREAVVDRIKPGLAARVTLPEKTLSGKVASVAPVTRPAGWWTGNVVRYDTIIELPGVQGLKPGMSAEVEIVVARHKNVLTLPVAAVVETPEGNVCWVKTSDGAQRRQLQLGDTNDVFTVVQAGLQEGDEVMLNPLAFMGPRQTAVRTPAEEAPPQEPDASESGTTWKPPEPGSDKPASDSQRAEQPEEEAAQ